MDPADVWLTLLPASRDEIRRMVDARGPGTPSKELLDDLYFTGVLRRDVRPESETDGTSHAVPEELLAWVRSEQDRT